MDGISKPAQRAEAVSALLAVVTLAGGGGCVDKALEAEGVWAELGKEGTPFLSAAATARIPAEEAASAAGLVEILLLQVSRFSPTHLPQWRPRRMPQFMADHVQQVRPQTTALFGRPRHHV